MAKDAFSFDIVSEIDLQEVRNAYDQAHREIITRFDFKNTDTSLSIDEDLIEIRSGTENRLKAAVDVLKEKLVRREVSLKALQEGPILPAARGSSRQALHVRHGIDDEKAREPGKFIRGLWAKVQTQPQGQQDRFLAKR